MSKLRNPWVKKRLELTRDHRVLALEGSETSKREWPLRKAQLKRDVRRAEHVALEGATTEPERADLAVLEARAALRTRRPKKAGGVALGDSIEIKGKRTRRRRSTRSR